MKNSLDTSARVLLGLTVLFLLALLAIRAGFAPIGRPVMIGTILGTVALVLYRFARRHFGHH